MNKLNLSISRKYEIIEMVGNGSYGTVLKAKNHTNGNIVALKVMKS